MLRVNEFQLYELASAVHPLTELSNEAKYSEQWFNIMNAKSALSALFNQRALEVCTKDANEFYAALQAVVPDDFDLAVKKLPDAGEAEPKLGYQSYTIRESAKKFETVLSAELSNSDTYWISPKGTHRTSLLLQSARAELPTAILKIIHDEAAIELDEAGRCLLFDVSTAAGFHLFRSTETVIRQFYEFIVGAIPAKKSRNWSAYIKGLRAKGADPKITGYLDHIREQYRNPVLHPEVTLTPEDAQVLFGVCISAIVMMASAMKPNTGAILPFPPSGPITTGALP
jgi:hypothetical protein